MTEADSSGQRGAQLARQEGIPPPLHAPAPPPCSVPSCEPPEKGVHLTQRSDVTLTRRAWSRTSSREKRAILRALVVKQRFRCAICKAKFQKKELLNIDHVIPIARGGTNRFTNLAATHVECNAEKADAMPRRQKKQ